MMGSRLRTVFLACIITITLLFLGQVTGQSTTVCEKDGAACQGVFTVVPTESACQRQFMPLLQDIGVKVDAGLARTELMTSRLLTTFQASVKNITMSSSWRNATMSQNVSNCMGMINVSSIVTELSKQLNMSQANHILNMTASTISKSLLQLVNSTSSTPGMTSLLHIQNQTLRQLHNLTNIMSGIRGLNSSQISCNGTSKNASTNMREVESVLYMIKQTLYNLTMRNSTNESVLCSNNSRELLTMVNETRTTQVQLATLVTRILGIFEDLRQPNQPLNASCNTTAIYQVLQRMENKTENQTCASVLKELQRFTNMSTMQNRTLGGNNSSLANFNFTEFQRVLQPQLETMLSRLLMNVSQRNSSSLLNTTRLETLIHSLTNLTRHMNQTVCVTNTTGISHTTSAMLTNFLSQAQNTISHMAQSAMNLSASSCTGNNSSLLQLVNAVVEQNNRILQRVGILNISSSSPASGSNRTSTELADVKVLLGAIQQQNQQIHNKLDEQDKKLSCIFKECPYGFVRNNCSCYKIVNRTATWNDARYACSTIGAHLLHVQSAEEQKTIGQQVASHYFEGDGFVSNAGFWLGGYDYKPQNTSADVNGVWLWETTNQNLTYFNWNEGEPNNWGETGEDCMLMTYYLGYKWNDASCTNTHVYICEIDLV